MNQTNTASGNSFVQRQFDRFFSDFSCNSPAHIRRAYFTSKPTAAWVPSGAFATYGVILLIRALNHPYGIGAQLPTERVILFCATGVVS